MTGTSSGGAVPILGGEVLPSLGEDRRGEAPGLGEFVADRPPP
eukprot:CAMPEP_0183811828 /NCGR_PEP_ID=MMETSP0803_2-20130417/50075_1 /TAXON_ID=195967 /ORGANISM="Crustomastix stigmata, Strain CCMP3273" /LENGTH=42 /DNA_ID= /DNA_START= /DNA_END= /DNA_ORIENTATION=